MQVERLLELITYLLGHSCSSAKQLADRFGVSVRTIQRDINTISLAGVPVAARTGSKGGYYILEQYKLSGQLVTEEDFEYIIMALKGLCSTWDDRRIDDIINKYLSLHRDSPPEISLDFGVAKEDAAVQQNLHLLEAAIKRHVHITFSYRNEKQVTTSRTAQPLALRFKWYAWYLLAYDVDKRGYRTFKVARICGLAVTDRPFEPPESIERILERQEQEYLKTCVRIRVLVKEESLPGVQEYFPDAEIVCSKDRCCEIQLRVPGGERLWKAYLLSFGDRVKVLEPVWYQKELRDTAARFLSNYDTELS